VIIGIEQTKLMCSEQKPLLWYMITALDNLALFGEEGRQKEKSLYLEI
jgi:hypothetical protein